MLTSHDVAEYLVNLANERGKPITNLQLQKKLYYLQGFYLALQDMPLFKETIQSWDHGPMVYEVYNRFSSYGKEPIPPQISGELTTLSQDVKSFISTVYEKYEPFSAWDIRELSHHESPWLEHPEKGELIPQAELKEFFLPRLGALGGSHALDKARNYIENKYNLRLSDEDLLDVEIYLELEDEKRELYARLADT